MASTVLSAAHTPIAASLEVSLEEQFPFSNVTTVAKAQEVFDKVGRDPEYLRRVDDRQLCTPAYFAFRELRNFELASQYLEWGGSFDTSVAHLHFLSRVDSLLFNYPRLSACIREAKWKAAKSPEQQRAVLQWILEESCHKGNRTGLDWVRKKQIENGFPGLDPSKSLENAIRGGFTEIAAALLDMCDPSLISLEKKKALVALCVDMGYPDLLLHLQRDRFPVEDEHLKEMEELASIQHSVSPHVRFPGSNNAKHNDIHGGDANLSIAEKEYKLLVGYVCHYIRKGRNIRTLIENLCHRRRRMAVLGSLSPLDQYGQPTNAPALTPFGESYRQYGEKIREKYKDLLPVQVKARIQGEEIPLTTFYADRWAHPNGKHRGKVLDEVASICENFRPDAMCVDSDFSIWLSQTIWLLSHLPPCMRGTPIVLRALIDGCCLLQDREPIDSRRELNCEALVYDDMSEFSRHFVRTTKFTPPNKA